MNRYEQPAQAQFINTYVPMPFEQLMAVGDKYRQELEKSEQKLAGFKKEHSTFQSLSDKDRQRYYDLTFGSIAPEVEKIASDPEYLKTAEGRSRIAGLINQVDYGQLSQLRQSAQALDDYNKTKAELQAKGLYNAEWDDVDLAGYDTSKSGTFTELSPMQYKSMKTLTDSYFDQLDKTKLLGKEGLWDVYGIDKSDLENVANEKVINEIYNLPEAQKHIEVAKRKGLIPEGMSEREWLRDNMVQSQVERLTTRKELNPLAIMQYKEDLEMKKINARAAAKGGAAGGSETPTMYNILTHDALQNEQALVEKNPEAFAGLTATSQMLNAIPQEFEQSMNVLNEALESGNLSKADYDKSVIGLVKTTENKAKDLTNPDNVQKQVTEGYKKMYESYLGIPNYEELSPKDKRKVQADARAAQATNQMLSAISTQAPGSVINKYNKKIAADEVSVKQGGNVVTGFNRPNSSNLQLAVDFGNKLMGTKQKATYKVKSSYNNTEKDFGADFRSGAIRDIIVLPDNQIIANKDRGETNIAQKIRVKIPKSSLIDMGYDSDSLDTFFAEKFGVKKETNINPKPISTKTVEDSYGTERAERWVGKGDITKAGAPYAGEYYTIEAVENIDPSTAGTIMFEHDIDKTVGGTKEAQEQRSTRVNELLYNL